MAYQLATSASGYNARIPAIHKGQQAAGRRSGVRRDVDLGAGIGTQHASDQVEHQHARIAPKR